MEHVQRQGGNKRIAQGVLLIEVTADGTWFLIPPSAPLVHEQAYLVVGVFLVHDGLVFLDDFLNLQTLAQRPVILVVVEIGGRTLWSVPA